MLGDDVLGFVPFLFSWCMLKSNFSKPWKERTEYACAVLCVCSSVTMGIASMTVHERHDIESGVLIFIAQLLLFAASIFHINYKLMNYGESKEKGAVS